jgi:hypothetical protein
VYNTRPNAGAGEDRIDAIFREMMPWQPVNATALANGAMDFPVSSNNQVKVRTGPSTKFCPYFWISAFFNVSDVGVDPIGQVRERLN